MGEGFAAPEADAGGKIPEAEECLLDIAVEKISSG